MKRYLRRCAALLSILMMICCVPVAADGAVYFTAVNETVLKLSDATMPFWANGILYVPSDMFADKELAITYYNNQVTKVVTLYDSSRALQLAGIRKRKAMRPTSTITTMPMTFLRSKLFCCMVYPFLSRRRISWARSV